ncbi:DUF6603 domain-containing protein [Endothiovibrio diazotrophicus]
MKTGADIESVVEQYLSHGKLSLPAKNNLDSSALSAIITLYFGGEISADGVVLNAANDSLSIDNVQLGTSGFSFYSATDSVTASLTFTAGSDLADTAIAIVITLPAAYRLSESFSGLAGLPGFGLDGLDLETVTLTIDSQQGTTTAAFSATVDSAASTTLSGTYAPASGSLFLKLQSGSTTQAYATIATVGDGCGTFFGLSTPQSLSLTSLPLVGSALERLSVAALEGFSILAADTAISATWAAALIKLIPTDYPAPPSSGLSKGGTLTSTLDLGGITRPLTLSLAASSPASSPAGDGTAQSDAQGAASATDNPLWYDVEKSFGPVDIQKIGVTYQDGALWALLNASLTAGPLTIALQGLGVGTPLTTVAPEYRFGGADLTLNVQAATASGGLVGTLDPLDLCGEILFTGSAFSLGALAGFELSGETPSLFAYGTVSGDFGGPPSFFVKGIALGFGLNRALVIPPVADVGRFPLVQWAMGQGTPSATPGSDPSQQIADTLATLTDAGALASARGSFWGAAGIRFTSYEVVDSFLLAAFARGGGGGEEIDLLGVSTLTLPPGASSPVVNAVLQLEASIAPAGGSLSILGQLERSSYLFDPSAHLSGGFAFCIWYGGAEQGQFLITIGGYNPAFTLPAYYPAVPRITLDWHVDDDTRITGTQYFAITSSAIMAGGTLSATWKSGPIKAWFKVAADFLMTYKPFHYYLAASCQLGCSVRVSLLFTHVTLDFHLGLGLELWGPSLSGKVHVHLSVISFTIGFGSAGQNNDTTLPWSQFVAEMLPGGAGDPAAERLPATTSASPPHAVVRLQVTDGALKPLAGAVGYLISPEAFGLQLESAIPIKTYRFAPGAEVSVTEPASYDSGFGVGPVGLAGAAFTSDLVVTLTDTEGALFTATPIVRNVPAALWQTKTFDAHGVPQTDPINDAVVADCLVGWELSATLPPTTAPLVVEKGYLEQTTYGTANDAYSAPVTPPSGVAVSGSVTTTIVGATASANRAALLAAINRTASAAVTAQPSLAGLADASAPAAFTAPPQSCLLGGTAQAA